MGIVNFALNNRIVTLVFTAVLIVAGWKAFQTMGRLEDPEFTVKDAQVITRYPGATALEVEQEVTDKLETAIQQLGQLKEVSSTSEPGRSTIQVTIKDQYGKETLPQVWDELRRKVGDARGNLPQEASAPYVYDDFGDVFGVYLAVYGDGYSYRELYEHAKLLRRELLLVKDVAKVTLDGVQNEAVYIEVSRSRLASLGIQPELIAQTVAGQNQVSPAGRVRIGDQHVRIEPTGKFATLADLEDLFIIQSDGTPSKLRIRDIARIRKGYVDPPRKMVRFNGQPAVAIGVSTASGGNAVDMGEAVMARIAALQEQTPVGIEVGVISLQSDSVSTAISGFLVSLLEAVLIVIGVLVFAMGFRSSLIIGAVLVITIMGTFIFMKANGVLLERISLGALIIALGMLVDNAIVVVEGIIIGAEKGQSKEEAAKSIVKQTIWPLLGATFIAVLAFAPIGLSDDATGEFCSSLFSVLLYSLLLSWVLAITTTPLLGVMYLKVTPRGQDEDPYGGRFYQVYRRFLSGCIRQRLLTTVAAVAALVAGVIGFGKVKQSFFPASTRPQIMVHYWLPQGTHIERTRADIELLEERISAIGGVTDVASVIGGGSSRFILTYSPENANTAYGMLLVGVEDPSFIPGLREGIDALAYEPPFSGAQLYSRTFVLGPGDPQKIHLKIKGPDHGMIRKLSEHFLAYFNTHPNTVDMNVDWKDRVPVIRPVIAESQARSAGITRSQINSAIQAMYDGYTGGQFREGDELLPIIYRSPKDERGSPAEILSGQIYSPIAGGMIPLSQVVLELEATNQDAVIKREDRLPTLTIMCDPKVGEASTLQAELIPEIEQRWQKISREWGLGSEYSYEWGGEYQSSKDAQGPLAARVPPIFGVMFLIMIALFNSIKKPLVIMMVVPFALIGVTLGLLLFNEPFGFMALLGLLSLVGMLIKNAIVLIDEINAQLDSGEEPFKALVNAGTSRLRPVSMAALTTILGMIPLIVDPFFSSMAVTVMFGLAVATVLTLVIIPVFYAIMFRVKEAE